MHYNYKIFKPSLCVFLFLLSSLFLIAQPPTISYEPAIGNLESPVDIVNAGDGSNRLFIVEQIGTIQVRNGTTLSQFADFGPTGANIVLYGGEQGLLSMVFHPDYNGISNRFFYIYYTDLSSDITVRRYQTTLGNINTVDLSSGTQIITIPHPNAVNSDGGKLNFGNDGYLYFATGDGEILDNAQNGSVLLGKMLRLNIDTTTIAYGNYGVPSDNPYIGDPNVDDRIWAIGLRNPFRWSFDRLTGDMWIGDVGQDYHEEISFRPSGSTGHVNYGWSCFEGYPSTPFVPDCTPVDYISPVFDYPNPSPGAAAVTGGVVYRGSDYPNFWGYYTASDVYSGDIFFLWPNGTGGFDSAIQTNTPIGAIVGYGEAEDGTLYAVSQQGDSVYKVVATGGVILPVRLLSFSASRKNEKNELKWVTASEINTANFQIEYGMDGRIFKSIGTLAAAGNPIGSSYSFSHYLNADNDVFYRLGIVNENGSTQYSSTIRLAGTKPKYFRIYPTVIQHGTFTLEILQSANTVTIINTSGSVVFKQDLHQFTGTKTIYLPMLANGIYIVDVTFNEGSQKEKIIIR